jgi:type IV secretion system protein VirD4
MKPTAEDQFFALLCIAVFLAILFYRRRRQFSGTAFGTATWMSESVLRARGFLAGRGLILGRTFSGALIRLTHSCHILLCGGTGSGKSSSFFIPNLLTYFRGSIACFDTKGELWQASAKRRAARGERILRLAPFNGGKDSYNPLDSIRRDSMLVDSARALAEALVVRGGEVDPHWNDRSVQIICAVLVVVLHVFKGKDRSLNSVQETVSDPELLKAAAKKLQTLGTIPARLGRQIESLFSKESKELTKEGASVLSTVTRHLSFLDSELVAKAVSTSTFDPKELRNPGITLFIQIGPEQLAAQKGLLRCWLASLIQVICAVGNEREGEMLLLLDEAEALESLPALEEMLVRGRSAGAKAVLAYQSDSQIRTAFKDKPTLVYDNCSTQIYLGAASSYETAERLSKSLGDWTQVVKNVGDNESRSWQQGGGSQSGGQMSRGSSQGYSECGRALLRPEEILTLNNDCFIALIRGMSPILGQRVKWYQDPAFNPAVPKRRAPSMWDRVDWGWRLWAVGVVVLLLLALVNRANH